MEPYMLFTNNLNHCHNGLLLRIIVDNASRTISKDRIGTNISKEQEASMRSSSACSTLGLCLARWNMAKHEKDLLSMRLFQLPEHLIEEFRMLLFPLVINDNR